MIITTDNYEEYFYRYGEGELTAEERAAVERFAAQHPELGEGLSLYDSSLKLEEPPMVYPDKEGLLRHEAKVLPLFQHTPALRATPLKRGWAVAACVAAVLIGGVWMMWPSGEPTEQAGMVARNRQPVASTNPIEPMVQKQEEMPTFVVEPTEPIAQPTEPTAPLPVEPTEQVTQYEPPVIEEPAMLAEAASLPEPQQEDTVVIEFIEMTIFPTYQPMVEEVTVAYQPTVGDRFRAFRSRVSNTVRDYAYQSYSDTRAELLTRINY